jgi:hypothetical protein
MQEWVKALPLGFGLPVVIGAASVKPEDAASNLAAWAQWVGIDAPPWLQTPGIDKKVILWSVILSIVYAFAVWVIPLLRSTHSKELKILSKSGAPYEVTEILHGNVLSTVRIGLKSRIPISNCKIYIETIAPQPPLYGSLPILLDGGGFIVRSDDPEKLVDVAIQWDHHDSKFRFNSPIGGMFAETLNFIDDDIPRIIEIKVVATELQKTALFKLWTDDTKKLHLERA